jgi:hypothetical protein
MIVIMVKHDHNILAGKPRTFKGTSPEFIRAYYNIVKGKRKGSFRINKSKIPISKS